MRSEASIRPKGHGSGASTHDEKTKERSERMKTKKPDPKSLMSEMYTYFTSYEDRGVPSFPKFARSVGLTTSDLCGMRSHKYFDRVYRECEQVRRDYLIDRALDKRFDPSFVRFVLTSESEERAEESLNNFILELSVKE